MPEIEPFTVQVPEAALADLRERLRRTRWPDRETVPDWSQGVPLAVMKELCAYWSDEYDWRSCEARLNALPQFTTRIDGLDIHFLHARSPHDDATPLLLTHGWPGSFVEFLDVIQPLTEPTAHGGSAADAFDVVIPSVPGYGFSSRPTETGWGISESRPPGPSSCIGSGMAATAQPAATGARASAQCWRSRLPTPCWGST